MASTRAYNFLFKNNTLGASMRLGMQDIGRFFDGVEDPHTSNAIRHNLHEKLKVAILGAVRGD